MERDKFIVNIASLAPRSAFDLDWAIEVAKETGYAGVSILPFWSCQTPQVLDLPVELLEKAWNPGSFRDLWRGFRGDPTAPKLQDLGLFPHSVEGCQEIFESWLARSNAQPVVHRWESFFELRHQGYNPLLEIAPGLWQSAKGILGTLGMQGLMGEKAIALDLWHIRRNPRPDEAVRYYGMTQGSALGRWENTMVDLLPYTGLIDFHPRDPDELFATLNGKGTELQRMVFLAKQEGYRGPWRVEIHLGLLGQLRFGQLTEALRATRNYLALAT